jgi:hypothetical protein
MGSPSSPSVCQPTYFLPKATFLISVKYVLKLYTQIRLVNLILSVMCQV